MLQKSTALLKKLGMNARTNLKILETLTYNFTEVHHLEELTKTLECLIKEYQCHLPTSNYLVLRHQAQQRARQIKRKYLALPLLQKRGKKRKDWRIHNRVGQKADTLRKVIY